MIKKLKLRFIISALFSVLIVLAATIAAINVSNYLKQEKEFSRLLDKAIENEHQSIRRSFRMFDDNSEEEISQQIGKYYNGHFSPDENQNEAPRGQYFVTVFGEDGSIWYTNFHTIDIDLEAGQQMGVSVYDGDKIEGGIKNYRFKKETINDKYQFMNMQEIELNMTFVSIVDTTDNMNAAGNYLINSLLIGGISYLVIALLIILSSQVVFKTTEESYRKQKAFVTNASHELKTPLTIISTDLELIEMDHGKDEWTESVRDQVNRLNLMTKQLVTLSKLDENNASNYPFANVVISKLAEESVDTFLPTFEMKKLHFTSDIAEGIEAKVNKYLISELFYIFLDNALKYTKDEGSINFTLKRNISRKAEIQFSNDISDQEIDTTQMFERFYRSPSSTKKEGSGIGLSIAKEIVELHKGKISASIKDNRIYFVINF